MVKHQSSMTVIGMAWGSFLKTAKTKQNKILQMSTVTKITFFSLLVV